MDATTLLITVYCLVDDWLTGQRLRQRGPRPTLADSEVLTIECVGEFWGIDTDKGLYDHFRGHYRDWFPALGRMHRTTFTRQAANLWAVKAQLRQQLLGQISFDPAVSILDSFPMPVCRFGRAYRCRRLAGLAAFGRDEGAKQTYYGVRAHLRVCWPGVIAEGLLAPANLHDLTMAEDLLADAHGWALGDRSYWSPARAELLADQGIWLLAPPSRSAKQPGPRLPGRLTQARRRIETVIGQLVERYHAKRVWARDAWHLWSRWQRKLLSHTLAVYLCQQSGLGSLRFADLLTPETRTPG
jgi:Transposase DDE domain